jgi:uncharacterized SAM-binding protein YcdF (DUF218 family)
MLPFLKALPTVSNYLLIWILLGVFLFYGYRRLWRWWVLSGLALAGVGSTSYVPRQLIKQIEGQYPPLVLPNMDTVRPYYVMVLGAGSGWDDRLPPSMNLSTTTVTRLTEGLRILEACAQATLVTSAGAPAPELKPQAQMVKEAALSLGVDAHRIASLHTPMTTFEEAQAFKSRFGTDVELILVTSALHMPRAMRIFQDQGMAPIPAPTDFMYKEDAHSYNGLTLPCLSSLQLMDIWQRTVLKSWYYSKVTYPLKVKR